MDVTVPLRFPIQIALTLPFQNRDKAIFTVETVAKQALNHSRMMDGKGTLLITLPFQHYREISPGWILISTMYSTMYLHFEFIF